MSTSIVKCRTQAQITPLGVDCETPMFSWQMAASRTGAKQSAYRIIVSKDKTMTPIIWDNNIVKSYIQHTALTADCTKLEPSTRYYWKVFVWDEENMMHESEVTWFETGLWERTLPCGTMHSGLAHRSKQLIPPACTPIR